MKIIDFDKKGNVVRFSLGADDCEDYWGDDWNDTPYEHNAGSVYSQYEKGYIDVAFPYDYEVLEPCSNYAYNGNTPFCKEDMKNRNVPCVIVIPPTITNDYWDIQFSRFVGSDNVIKFYFNDKDYKEKIKLANGIILREGE